MQNPTTSERVSDRELVVTRTFNGPPRIVWEAWTNSALFGRWWLPKSFGLTLVSCELDVRVGGGYRLLIRPPGVTEPMAFFGRYLEVVPHARLVWTNDEGAGGGQVTTVTFEEKNGQTLVVMRDLYPSKDMCDGALADGSTSGTCQTFDQLDEVLAEVVAA